MSNIDKIQVGNTTYDIVSSSGTNTFTSGDVNDGEATSWTSVVKMATGDTTTSIIEKISNMFKNIRFLYSKLGSADISGVGNSLSEAIVSLNNTVTAVDSRLPAPPSPTTGYVLTGLGWRVGTKYNADTNTTYTTFTSAAAGLVPAAANGSTSLKSTGYVLTGAGWQAGTKYNTDTDTTYAVFTSATATANGTKGLVPAPTSGLVDRSNYFYLKANGRWGGLNLATSAEVGGVKLNSDTTKYLNGNGAWTVPYSEYVPTSTASGRKGGLVTTPPLYSSATGRQFLSNDPAIIGSPNNGWGVVRWSDVSSKQNFSSAAPGLVPAAEGVATTAYVLTGAGWKAGTKYNTDTTYPIASSSAPGLMSTYAHGQVAKINSSMEYGLKGTFDSTSGVLTLEKIKILTAN